MMQKSNFENKKQEASGSGPAFQCSACVLSSDLRVLPQSRDTQVKWFSLRAAVLVGLLIQPVWWKTTSVCLCVFQPGDRVYTAVMGGGAYAEYAVAAEDCVHKLHDALDFSQGAAIGVPYFTAYRALVHK